MCGNTCAQRAASLEGATLHAQLHAIDGALDGVFCLANTGLNLALCFLGRTLGAQFIIARRFADVLLYLASNFVGFTGDPVRCATHITAP
ncbi:hypothetical protein AGR9A_Cc190025 [Agrobacterium salinitolerans str. Hayward 0363]|nr:hypothetical protein AGR9A_Cc190025 [Agrobacterium salinitolerans str. Hayward 0363]